MSLSPSRALIAVFNSRFITWSIVIRSSSFFTELKNLIRLGDSFSQPVSNSTIVDAIQSDKYLKMLDALGVQVIREDDVPKYLEAKVAQEAAAAAAAAASYGGGTVKKEEPKPLTDEEIIDRV